MNRLVEFTLERLPAAGIATHDGHRWRMTEAYAAQRGSTRRGVIEVLSATDIVEHPACAMSIATRA